MSRPVILTLCVVTLLPTLARSQRPVVMALANSVEHLRSSDAFTRSRAAEALGALGASAESAVPALVRALGDRDPFVARAASDALGRIGVTAVPELLSALRSPNRHVRYRATVALSLIGPTDLAAQKALAQA